MECTRTGHIGPVWSVVFTPDGKGLLSDSHDGVQVRCWDTWITQWRTCSNKDPEIRRKSVVSPDAHGLPPVYPTTVLSSRMPTAPYVNAHLLDLRGSVGSVSSSPIGSCLALAMS